MNPEGAVSLASKEKQIVRDIDWEKCFICQNKYGKYRQDKKPFENGLKYQNTSSRAGDPYSICLHNVTDELRAGLARGEIYLLKTVWERYCTFLGDFDLEPGIYKGQRFKLTKLEKLLQEKALFVKSLKPTDSFIIFPEMTAGTALLNMMNG